MELLLDQNISNRIVNKLIDHFPGIKHVKDFGLSESRDSDIWEFARRENYVIITFDSDFYDMVLLNDFPPKIIWLRTGNIRTNELAEILISNINRIKNFVNNNEDSDLGCLEID